MAKDYVDVDAFGSTISGILGELADKVGDSMPDVVREGAKVGRREWRANAPVDTGAYAKTITYRVKKTSDGATAEIGSSTMPGLPHLLEKGHAKVGGGRVAARVHIAPAAEDAFDATEEAAEKAVEEAIRAVAS